MQNRNLGVLIMFIIFSWNPSKVVFGQGTFVFDTKITYNLSYLGDSTDEDTWRKELVDLFVSDTLSFFETTNLHVGDSVSSLAKEKRQTTRMNYTYFSYKILKANRKIRVYDNLFTRSWPEANFYYEEPANDLNWKLAEETKIIHGRLCQIAYLDYGNRKWTAYFDPNIPIFDGPYIFCGLPGLIIQVKDETGHWNFSLNEIKQGGNFICTLKPVLDSKYIEKKEFYKRKRYTEENVFQIQEARSNRRNVSRSQLESMKERLERTVKAKSNWIELYR